MILNFTNNEINDKIDKIFKFVDTDNSSSIEYQEFIRACITKESLINDDILNFAFGFFDKDGSGQITVQELYDVFSAENIVSENILKLIIDEIDTNGDGQISFDEFKNMMKFIK